MTKTTLERSVVWAGLVAAAVAVRLGFHEIPNFAPVAAVSLFAGYYFRTRLAAVAVPLSVMVVSDRFLGGYQWPLMLTVYGLLALPVWLRGPLRRYFDVRSPQRSLGRSAIGLLSCSLASSLLFFLGTNLVTWLVTPWYPRTAIGLWTCYANAVPFFRYTLAGDIVFAALLFGGYALVCTSAARADRRVATA